MFILAKDREDSVVRDCKFVSDLLVMQNANLVLCWNFCEHFFAVDREVGCFLWRLDSGWFWGKRNRG